MKILVLEDDKLVQKAYQRMFDGEHEVRYAFNPTDGHAVLAEGFQPDLIVSDWDMPGGTGGDFCRALREQGNLVPFVVVSGIDRSGHQVACGFDRSLQKPFRLADLQDVITKLVRLP